MMQQLNLLSNKQTEKKYLWKTYEHIYEKEGDGFPFFVNPWLRDKLDLMIKRCTGRKKSDNLLIIDGDEGSGKTTLSILVAKYVSWRSGRPFNQSHVFFNSQKLMDFIISTKDQIIIWDEAALSGLSSEWYNKEQKKLLKLLMVARKKRHFIIFNVPKFFRLNEYFVLDRAIAMLHTYENKGINKGYFVYFSKSGMAVLYDVYRKKKWRMYHKYFSFHGRFNDNLSKIIDEEAYDFEKDKAILSINDKDLSKKEVEIIMFKQLLGSIKEIGGIKIDKKDFAKALGVSPAMLTSWSKYGERYEHLFKSEDKNDLISQRKAWK